MSHRQETQTAVHIGTGIAPLLMLFCLLCMTTFAVLSYVQANAQLQLSDKAISRCRRITVKQKWKRRNADGLSNDIAAGRSTAGLRIFLLSPGHR